MNIDKIREWYASPPRNNDIAGWNEIHATMETPGGSDHAMRQWAVQRMGRMLLEEAKRNKCDCGQMEHGRHHMDCPAVTCNNVAKPATIAQDAPQGQPSAEHGQSVESRLAETVARLEDMREDLVRLHALSGKMHDFWADEDYEEYKAIGKKWGIT